MKEERSCLNCGDKIKGRADKKFCDDQCRNAYNNMLNEKANNSIRKINNILKQNRRILENIFNRNNTHSKVHKQSLINRGFRMNYHTHQFSSKSGALYYFSYEYGILLQGEDVIVVRREESSLS